MTLPSPEFAVLATERDRMLWQAVEHVPARHRERVHLLATPAPAHRCRDGRPAGHPAGQCWSLRRRALDRLWRTLLSQGHKLA